MKDFPNEMMYFSKYKTVMLKNDFRFNKEHLNKAMSFLKVKVKVKITNLLSLQVRLVSLKIAKQKYASNLGGPPCVLVSVHVRRTDYQKYLQKRRKEGGLFLSKQFYIDAMNYYRDKFKHPLFIVASDDLNWSMKNLKARDVQFTFDPVSNKKASAFLDMTILGKSIQESRFLIAYFNKVKNFSKL